jgi:hypothetical protein
MWYKISEPNFCIRIKYLFAFYFIEKEDNSDTTSRRRDTHMTVLTKQLQLSEKVTSTTDRNDIRPRSAFPLTKNGDASRLGATG